MHRRSDFLLTLSLLSSCRRAPVRRGDARRHSCPSPLGEREGPAAKRREGEVASHGGNCAVLTGDYPRCDQPGTGKTGAISAFSAGNTTVGRPSRFCTPADGRLVFWPL